MSLPKMSLGALFEAVDCRVESSGDWKSIQIESVCVDSRNANPGCLFFAIPGAKHDGGEFVQAAASAGARACVVDASAKVVGVSVPLIRVSEIRAVLPKISANFFNRPSNKLLCVGVTGTNGKTSVSWMVAQALTRLDRPASVCGTLGIGHSTAGEYEFQSSANTTPDASLIQDYLADSLARGEGAAVLEVTSQGLVQHRTSAIEWDVAAFTNLTRDHLDLHQTMENYAAAKALFFTDELAASSKPNRAAVINVDDAFGAELAAVVIKELPDVWLIRTSAQSTAADVCVLAKRCSMNGTELECRIGGEDVSITLQLIGDYNISNALTSAGILYGCNISAQEIARALGEIPPVPGRLEVMSGSGIFVVVDYAHTPDALLQAQKSLRELTPGKLITVFGCGGDRDRGKRPLMGQVVAELSDIAVVTSDNPRTENPELILDEIMPGLREVRPGFRVEREVDRRSAIRRALAAAVPGDVVLVAGKGHEDYQEIAGVRHPFSDTEVCREMLKAAAER